MEAGNLHLTYHLLSEKGNRKNNEDRVGSYKRGDEFCFALADGLGGHEKGEVASTTVVDTCIDLFKEEGFSEFVMRDAFEIGQERLLNLQAKNRMPDDFKSTLVLLCINETMINWGHIGDSRLYYFKNKKKVLHTLDHSVPQVLVNIGEIQDSDIRNHPDRNHLLSAMGIEWQRPRYEIAEPIITEPGTAFLMASDGFWELISDEEMVKCLKKANDVHQWMTSMEKIVKKTGEDRNMDNYSAIGIWIEKD